MKVPATHLTCPFCPAQACPQITQDMERWALLGAAFMVAYRCPAKHEFWVKGEESIDSHD